jgi:WD40 repeat protein
MLLWITLKYVCKGLLLTVIIYCGLSIYSAEIPSLSAILSSKTKTPLLSLSLAPDGKTFVTGDYEGTVTVWDINKKQEIAQHSEHTGIVTCVSYSPDSKMLASGGWGGDIVLWTLENGRKNVLHGHSNIITSLIFSPNGKILASGSKDKSIRLWNIPSGELLALLEGHTDVVSSLVFNKSGDIIISASGDGSVRLWSIPSNYENGQSKAKTEKDINK